MRLGVDIGSTTVKLFYSMTVTLSYTLNVRRHMSVSFETVLDLLKKM